MTSPMTSPKPTLTRQNTNREGEDLPEPLKIADLKALQNAKVTLYQFDESPPCWKVRALLPYTIQPILYTLYQITCTAHLIPYTLHPIPYTLYPVPYTL